MGINGQAKSGSRTVAIAALAVAAALGLGAQLANAGPSGKLDPNKKPRIEYHFLSDQVTFQGKVVANDEACRARKIKIYNADTGGGLAATKSNDKGVWERRLSYNGSALTFYGSAYASALKKKVPHLVGKDTFCAPMRSNTVTFKKPLPVQIQPSPPGQADLAVTKTAIGDNAASVEWKITVTNNGPQSATGVLVTDDPASTFVATGSDSRCGPNGGSTFSCDIPFIGSGTSVDLTVRTDCGPTNTNNSTAVVSSTADPNFANNAIGATAYGACM